MKKGFSLIELLVSIIIISITLLFITSFLQVLKSNKEGINLNVSDSIDRVSVSKELNESSIKYRIDSILKNSDKKLTINYKNGIIGVIEIINNDKTLKYTENSNIRFVKTLSDSNATYEKVIYDAEDENYYKLYSNSKRFIKYIIKVTTNNNVEVYYYGD